MGKLIIWLLAAGKMGKLLTTCGTMLISIVVYSWVFGWRYAAGFVALIFVHEMGHYVAARQRGLDVGAPTFIPFVGAWIALKELPHDVETEAYIGFAGPLAGTLASVACYFIARDQDSNLLLALAYSGCMINLFNLIPVSPLDGGRITAIISPKVWLAGVPLLAALFFYHPSPMLILVAVLAYPQLKEAIWGNPDKAAANYYDVPRDTRINYGVMYLGLVAFLAMMSYSIHNMLDGSVN
ncbi:site-2 protease family protein [Pseudoduganella sp. FT25W]|jgi:Zn-dependent protease|uniref:Site-2 protease family protein n=1 Tax=Duganella alba TaxID=2666081 RepID=A0A6L5QLZ5_9BURK|nr:site-2 protease family protein [Duganella alba]MRX10790.1 site-2 protease family protein [Duganella alba]MRX18909.1 site-2 protease family protein [Duganella alba]